jgi:hypothetical protein
MAMKFFNFGYFPAKNRIRSKSVSQKKFIAYCVRRFAKIFKATHARRALLFKNEVAARAAQTINLIFISN